MSRFFSPEHLPGALLLAILFVALGLILSWLVRKILRTAWHHNQMARVDEITLSFLSHLAVLLIWVLLAKSYAHLIPALNKLGTAMLGSVSLASVIIGFAAQTTLGNLVSGISLGRTIAVLDIGAMDDEANHQAGCIDDYVALAALDSFARIIAANTAAFGGLTLWLSITPAEGEASRPSSSRVSMTR